MSSNHHKSDSVVPSRVSVLVETSGGGEDGRSSSGTNPGIAGLGVDPNATTTAGRGETGEGMSPGSEMAMDYDPVAGPTAIPADEGDVSRPSSGAAKVDTAGLMVAGREDVDAVTPRDGEAVANDGVRDVGEEGEADDHNKGDDNVADDESDYSYEYDEDEDEGHYSGFLIPTEPVEAGNGESAAASASAIGGNDANVVASEDAVPHTVSRAASRNGSDVGAARSSSPDPEERKPKWREPTRAAVNMSLRAEKEKTGGRRRLASDLYKIMMADTEEAGFSLEPTDEDSMEKWCIKLFGFDEDSNLAKDLMVCGMDHVELQMSFPDQYPFEPPFVRVVRPRFRRQTGFVMSGALCMELLTKDGWNPINDIESVIVSIRSLMVVGDGRLQAAVDMGKDAYKKALATSMKRLKGTERAGPNDDKDDDVKMGKAKRKRAPSADDDDGDSKPTGSAAKKVTGGSYSAAEAQSAYDHLSKYHKKEGWDKSGWWSRKG